MRLYDVALSGPFMAAGTAQQDPKVRRFKLHGREFLLAGWAPDPGELERLALHVRSLAVPRFVNAPEVIGAFTHPRQSLASEWGELGGHPLLQTPIAISGACCWPRHGSLCDNSAVLAHILGGVFAGLAVGSMLAGGIAKGIVIVLLGSLIIFGHRLSDPALFRPRD